MICIEMTVVNREKNISSKINLKNWGKQWKSMIYAKQIPLDVDDAF